jgi:pyruvate,orthophosphate dikinase
MNKTNETHKWIYIFSNKKSDGNASMKNILGGKGAGLAEMTRIGLPVPDGFTITTEVCTYYNENNKTYPIEYEDQFKFAMAEIEKNVNKKFGDLENPLLLSVRSGARVSMPGMMDTILNLGLNDQTVEGLSKNTKNSRFAYDSYRRFIQMYGNIVMHVSHSKFEKILSNQKVKADVVEDRCLSAENLKEVIVNYKQLIIDETGFEFPQDTQFQLREAINAVFRSWNNDRAITYRKLNDISDSWGTAVNVMKMVFGNFGDDSATGVAFTRNPSTGENIFFGEYLINAQGEDVVAGIRTPQQISRTEKIEQNSIFPSMEEMMPNIYKELNEYRQILEKHYQDMQDIEFTIESGKLYILQQRSGKKTGKAAIKIAVDMYEEGIITKEKALLQINASSLNQLLHPTLDPKAEKIVLARGLPASPGAAWGKIVLSAEEAIEESKNGHHVLLVREETSPDDIHGMHVAQGILTCRGGMTSHAAVIARGMGRACICGAGDVVIEHNTRRIKIGKQELSAGDIITIDGDKGEILLGKVNSIQPELCGGFATIMKWSDEIRRLKIRANAETPMDAKQAVKFGCQGIGLVRTEHMFFNAERILSVRKMIIADSDREKKSALCEITKYQTQDFTDLFKIMETRPVTIRLLDPPLHEFLPKEEHEIKELSSVLNMEFKLVEKRIDSLREFNPMLGNRGCRLGITRPEITEMQIRAIFQAVVNVEKECGFKVVPEIMIPVAFCKKELDILYQITETVKKQIETSEGMKFNYLYGTMIELPRACLVADDLAKTAEFFSFGTNDLTQTTFGISRDDFTFYDYYKNSKIFENDPFATIDTRGVGELMKLACEKGRKTNTNIKIGICGEHGGDPMSIKFAESLNLDYVSCSPFRIPIARLAAAQAVILKDNR